MVLKNNIIQQKKVVHEKHVDSYDTKFKECTMLSTNCRHDFLNISYFHVQVAKDPSGKDINALEQHIKNLLCPSTPFFFNTLYDPYRAGADFVRGYPFSLREGAPTAVSHGLWLNIPDYDAPTQLVKPLERNTRYVLCNSFIVSTNFRRHIVNEFQLNPYFVDVHGLILFTKLLHIYFSGMLMLFLPFPKEHCSPCVV